MSLFPELYARSEFRVDEDIVLLTLDGWPASRDIGYFCRAGSGRAAQFEELARGSEATCAAIGLSSN
ncbi:type 2 periplasmic-binding domain-containing protein [Ancylobacter terrae]|uniref:hypothetical protein n=1 Tax=Ancylobacter sp. sgz301288 TaxID=3342077 RepID=UPI00385EF951